MDYIGINTDAFLATKYFTGKFKEHSLITFAGHI
jgi:hypothetical protein